MIQSSMSAANTSANGVEAGPSAVGRGLYAMNVFNKARGLLAFGRRAVHRRFLPGPSTRMTCNPPKILILVYPGVPKCTAVYRAPHSPLDHPFSISPRVPKNRSQNGSKSIAEQGSRHCWRGAQPAVWRVGWKSPKGWLCRMAFPKHMELRRSGIFKPE
jgi:hypothetical protein